jgi:hypothetical protein
LTQAESPALPLPGQRTGRKASDSEWHFSPEITRFAGCISESTKTEENVMRKITRKIAEAFVSRKHLTVDNTETDGMNLWLHGNLIAANRGDCIIMTLADWPTPTTRERLNGLCELIDGSRPFYQHNRKQYFDHSQISKTDTIIWNPSSRTKTLAPYPIDEVLNSIR